MTTAALLGVVAAGRAVAAPSDEVAHVEEMVRRADFGGAEAFARDALSSGNLDRRAVAGLQLQLGIVAMARGDTTAAEVSFRRAFALDRALELPPYVGPHVARAFARAAGVVRAAPPIATRVTIGQREKGGEAVVDARIEGDAEGLARRLRLRGAPFDEAHDLEAGYLHLTVAPPPSLSACVAVTASVLDEHGNELWPAVAHADICPAQAAAVVATPAFQLATPISSPARQEHADVIAGSGAPVPVRRVPAYVWAAAAVSVAAIVTTGVLGGVALSRRSDYETAFHSSPAPADDARLPSLYDHAATAEHRATIASLVTLGVGATTAILYFTRPRRLVSEQRIAIGPGRLAFIASF